MAIQLTCPHCGLQGSISEEYAGQSGPCAQCGKRVTVPLVDVPVLAPPARSKAPLMLAVVLLLGALGLLVCGGILYGLFAPAAPNVATVGQTAGFQDQCSYRLKTIGLAMQMYHQKYRCFPPAYVADKAGRPAHSWRVLLLPFLDQEALYAQYRLDEPWDSAHNLLVAQQVPAVYQCPETVNSGVADPLESTYVMVVGKGRISSGTSATPLEKILRGSANLIVVVESAGTGIGWTEPRDLDADTASFAINDGRPGVQIGSTHPGGAHVLFGDGSVEFFAAETDPATIRAMSAIAGE